MPVVSLLELAGLPLGRTAGHVADGLLAMDDGEFFVDNLVLFSQGLPPSSSQL